MRALEAIPRWKGVAAYGGSPQSLQDGSLRGSQNDEGVLEVHLRDL